MTYKYFWNLCLMPDSC